MSKSDHARGRLFGGSTEPEAVPTTATPVATAPSESESTATSAQLNKLAGIVTEFTVKVKDVLLDHESRITALEECCKALHGVKPAKKPEAVMVPATDADIHEPDTPAASAVKTTPMAPVAPAAKTTPTAPAPAPETPAAPAAKTTRTRKSAATPMSEKAKLEEETKTDGAVSHIKNGPGYAYRYWNADARFWGLKVDLWAAKQAGNGIYEPIWVMYRDGTVDHILTSEEIKKYAP